MCWHNILVQNVSQARAQKKLFKSRGGHPGLPVPKSPEGLCGSKATFEEEETVLEFRSCVKVQVDILISPSLVVRIVSVDVKQHLKN